MIDSIKKRFGLLGRNISYSFSKGYFTEKFNTENFTGCSYENFDIPEITDFPQIVKETSDLKGLNVTIPYKEAVLPFLDKLSKKAVSDINIDFSKKTPVDGNYVVNETIFNAHRSKGSRLANTEPVWKTIITKVGGIDIFLNEIEKRYGRKFIYEN